MRPLQRVGWSVVAITLWITPLAFGQFDGLVINEILPSPTNAAGIYVDANNDGAANSFDDEFVELLNTSTNPIDVAGLWLTDANTNIQRHVFNSRILPPGGSIVVFGGGSLLNFSNPPAQIATGGGLSLNNDSETVSLFSSPTTLVDQVSYQMTASHNAISTVRDPDGTGTFTNHYLATTNTVRASPGFQVHGLAFLTNHPPVLLDLLDQTAFVGLELLVPVRAYDPADRDAITLSVLNNPSNSSFSSTGGVGTLTMTATADQAGQVFDVSFVASDDDGAETNTISLQVINPNADEDIWINEIHYDNDGVDVNEGVEIAGTAGSVLSDYSLILYNGLNGNTYNSNALTGTLDDENCGFGAAWFGFSQLQNETEGIALVKGTNVIQFLSYEGVLTASNGPAEGMPSIDIGVHETAATLGYSLQLVGTGTAYSAFTWTNARPHSRGNLNDDQEIICLDPPSIEIQKTVYLGHDSGASAPGVESIQGTNGAPVTYVFTVSNTGGTTLTNVTITDISLGITPIDLGTMATGMVSTSYVEAVLSGDLRNTATVSGYDPDEVLVSDDDTAEVVEIILSLYIQKTVYRGHDAGAGCPGSDFLQATNNTPVTYCFLVENNGNTNLNSLTLTDDDLGITPIVIGTLEAGGVFFTSVEAVVTGSLTNTATVDGVDPNSDPVSAQDTAVVEMISPAILLQKTVYLGHDGGASCPGSEQVSDTNGVAITFCFQVSNSGDSTLTNVVLRDAGLPGFPDTDLGSLTNGESTSVYFESTINSSRLNTATATAYTVLGTLIADENSATVIKVPGTNMWGGGEYEVVDLGTLGGDASVALDINDRSQAVGWSKDTNGNTQAFIWDDDVISGLGFLPGGSNSVASAINNHGIITGNAHVTATNWHVFSYSNATMSSLGAPVGPHSSGLAINDLGKIVGSTSRSNSSYNQSFVWQNSTFICIPPFHETTWPSCDASGINEDGWVCGITAVWATDSRWWSYVWFDANGNGADDEGEMHLLGSLGIMNSSGSQSGALAINDLGQVVGWSSITNTWTPHHAFLVSPSNGQWKIPAGFPNPTNALMQDLGTLDGENQDSYANGINNRTWIVGQSTTGSGTNQAFLWRNGTMFNLNNLIATNTGWVLTNATAINNNNEIVGSGIYEGQQRAYMLRQQGRITDVVPVIGTVLHVFTNEFLEVVTQEVEQVETQIIHWAGLWGANPSTPKTFTVEYCDALHPDTWIPFAPTSQWPIADNVWTNTDFSTVSVRFFRVRAQDW